jgi:REP element-mobilizing transposase RayT
LASHTYVVSLVHCVFSTKERRRLITSDLQPRLWSFIGGIARKNGFKALIVGGTDDPVHALLSLPATIALANAVQLIKGASSRWMNETVKSRFAWQEGCGASPLECRRSRPQLRTSSRNWNITKHATFERNLWHFSTGMALNMIRVSLEINLVFQASPQDALSDRSYPALKRRAIFTKSSFHLRKSG